MKKMITALVLVLGLGGQAFASAKMQKEMVRTIDAIGVTFNTLYAPAPWKKEYASWELEVELDKAKLAVTSNKDITVKDLICEFENECVNRKLKRNQKNY